MNSARLNLGYASALSLSMLLAAGLLSTPARAGLINEPDPALGAKINPNVKTGVRYWIELKRHGKTFHVTNQEKFATGDQIRFHVQATVDGYAYIVLRSGSQGEQAVLFPLEKSMDNNKLNRETDYALPADDYLTFDSHPGTEKVTLLFSKRALDPTKVMATTFKDSNHVVLRAPSPGVSGSKDLIPARTTVTYQSEEALLKDDAKLANDAVNGAKPDQGMINSVIAMSTTAPTYNPSAHAEAVAAGDDETLTKANAALKKVDSSEPRPSAAGKANSSEPESDTTVIQNGSSTPSGSARAEAVSSGSNSAPQQQNVLTSTPGASSTETKKADPLVAVKNNLADTKISSQDDSKSSNKVESTTSVSMHKVTPAGDGKSNTGAVIVRQDDPEKVLHIDVDLEHSGT